MNSEEKETILSVPKPLEGGGIGESSQLLQREQLKWFLLLLFSPPLPQYQDWEALYDTGRLSPTPIATGEWTQDSVPRASQAYGHVLHFCTCLLPFLARNGYGTLTIL